ncbi:MAG: cupin domain-containing protein [Bradyrhizobium sp.]
MTTATIEGARVIIDQLKTVPSEPINHSAGHEHDQGTVQRVISKAVNGSPDILATVFSMTPNQYHPLHAHPELGELYFILEGACEVRVGTRTEWVTAQTAIYVPKGTPHSLRTKDQNVKFLLVFPEGDRSKVKKVWVEE